MFTERLPKVLYGGDYNPEQWPREVWEEDMRLFRIAGVDIATINVFSWARNQPDEQTYRFEWLDKMMDRLHAEGIRVCLGTSTAAHPAWMATRYPDVLITEHDGRRRKFGRRHNSCPNSPTYRLYAERLARRLAERYRDHPALLLWHVNNEYGLRCYCDHCERAFRVWLREKYGTLEALNAAWYTSFWGHTFYDWDEIVLPSALSEHLSSSDPDATAFPSISLDYDRFNSEALLSCYKLERDAIKDVMPDAVVTTNFQGNGTYKPLDYFKWARELDVIALDMYPADDMTPAQMAMRYDLMRGLKGGEPFLLMESCPTQLNWRPRNAVKRPGVNRLWSLHAVARGADAVMYFQLRRSLGAFEKFHGAMIDHAGHEHTRVFRECAGIGEELRRLGDALPGARTKARAAIVFDWDNWWAIEHSSGLTVDLRYVREVEKYYAAFYAHNLSVDLIGVDAELGDYDLVVAPVLYMLQPGYAARLERFVEQGGTLVTTTFSGIVDQYDRVIPGGYPGELRELLGLWVEEIDAPMVHQPNRVVMTAPLGGLTGPYDCGVLCDVIHTEGADTVAVFEQDYYAGSPALTRNRRGAGEAWYLATSPEHAMLRGLIGQLCDAIGIEPVLATPAGVEATVRAKGDERFLFLLNHNETAAEVELEGGVYVDLLSGATQAGALGLPARDVRILRMVAAPDGEKMPQMTTGRSER
ncbi:beta-galactosidase [Paenibacillus sp. 598K]|uniref:beta-galactosidase n=1 Tax=Paenibacillus sp. 598K TaxID=1117987 RepID=UPI000FFAD6ED|nr:beta-galactosidase [Paenibacillus sp. 598K]GBF75608.1 beta-galactosidase [Paenibacillus sp. 598K]